MLEIIDFTVIWNETRGLGTTLTDLGYVRFVHSTQPVW